MGELTEELCACGLGSAQVSVGSNLSYEDEAIVCGRASELRGRDFPPLSCLLVEHEGAGGVPVTQGLPDESFLRGSVPMTKEEVRSVSLSKLRLTEDAVVYDVGAGTGSVSVEAALLAWRGRVYAIERKGGGLRAHSGELPPVGGFERGGHCRKRAGGSGHLPAPHPCVHRWLRRDHGGDRPLHFAEKPPGRVVINAIALETLSQVLALSQELPFPTWRLCKLLPPGPKRSGGYHMMNGGNPVFICSFGGLPWQVQD